MSEERKNEFERRFCLCIYFAGGFFSFFLLFILFSSQCQWYRTAKKQNVEKWEREQFVQFPNYEWFIVLFPFDQIKIITNAKTKVMQTRNNVICVCRPTGRGYFIDAGHGAYRFCLSFMLMCSFRISLKHFSVQICLNQHHQLMIELATKRRLGQRIFCSFAEVWEL